MRILVAGAIALALTGCSFSPYDSVSTFTCKASPGVPCLSMTGIYENAQQNNLPGMRTSDGSAVQIGDYGEEQGGKAGQVGKAATPVAGALAAPLSSGTPIRSPIRVLRAWFAPWVDADGDLYDQFYVYLPVDTGRWLIEHNQQRIRDEFRPLRPPAAPINDAGQSAKQAAGQAPKSAADLMSQILPPSMNQKTQ